MPADPTLDLERRLLAEGATIVIGCDEVGRGAIAGPVAVGVAVASSATLDAAEAPSGLRDSKLLSEKRREELAPQVASWLPTAVGLASPREIEARGIVSALGLAGFRALAELHRSGVVLAGGVVLLDGSHDWLTRELPAGSGLRVVTRVKADRDCAVVAAASVVAKVHRDELMRVAHVDAPHFGWESNKGYGSSAHGVALRAHGAHSLHRASWVEGILAATEPLSETP